MTIHKAVVVVYPVSGDAKSMGTVSNGTQYLEAMFSLSAQVCTLEWNSFAALVASGNLCLRVVNIM